METVIKIIGICICFASLFSVADLRTIYFHLPLIFALGCIVFCLGDICGKLRSK